MRHYLFLLMASILAVLSVLFNLDFNRKQDSYIENSFTGIPRYASNASSPFSVISPETEDESVVGIDANQSNEQLYLPFNLELGEALFSGTSSTQPSVTGIEAEMLSRLDPGMVNVTADYAAYRLSTSLKSLKSFRLSIPFDAELLPPGYSEDDIQTFCFDSRIGHWMSIPRDSVEAELQLILSSAELSSMPADGGEGNGGDASLDFINAVIKTPEMPEAASYTPTSIKELEAANPLEGLALMQPPAANNNGTANLSYPIEIPAGRQGMQPNLALTYNSSGGNGWLGVGWDISIPSITVETRWGVPRYDHQKESEVYVYEGEQLVTYDSTAGDFRKMPHRTNQWTNRLPDGTQFYPRKNEAFDSIVRHGNSPDKYWWSVTHRNGVTDYYGKKLDSNSVDYNSVLCNPQTHSIAQWMLTESVDVNGNWVRYYYDKTSFSNVNEQTPGVQIYIKSIVYTGKTSVSANMNESGKYKIFFHRKSNHRSDISINLNHGLKETLADLLCNLCVNCEDTEIRAYSFFFNNDRNSNFKTMLTDVVRIDNGKVDEEKCYDDISSWDGHDIVRTHFDYFDAPAPNDVFGNVRQMDLSSSCDQVKSFFITNPASLGNADNATALGATRGKSWNVGGTATVGLGPVVPLTSLSVGGNFNYSRSQSQGALTLIDLDGDGLSDKVFKKGKNIYYRKQIADSDTSFHFGDTMRINGISDFLHESSSTTTWGLQASAGCAYSGSWPQTTSMTSVYFADVNADGLPDLVTDDGVLFNVIENGRVTFRNYYLTNNEDNLQTAIGDTIITGADDCGGIIFDGEVDDSIACSLDWEFYKRFFIKDSADYYALIDSVDSFINTGLYDCVFRFNSYDSTRQTYVIQNGCMDVYQKTIRCTPKSFDPDLETVRVWVAPKDGIVNIASTIKLLSESSVSYAQSKYCDGVRYSGQICRGITADSQYILHSNQNPQMLWRDSIAKNDTASHSRTFSNVSVSKGDILFFRLQSGMNHSFDKVIWEQEITFNGDTVTFNSTRDFIVSGDKYFQAHKDNARYALDIRSYKSATQIDTGCLVISSTHNHVLSRDTILLRSNVDTIITFAGNLFDRDSILFNFAANDLAAFDIRPHICYIFPDTINGQAFSDTLDYYPPVNMLLNNWQGTREDTVCHWLFGPLYQGWGQFVYHNNDTAAGSYAVADSVIELSALVSTLIPRPQNAAEAAQDTASINSFVPARHTNEPQEFSAITDTFSNHNIFNPLSTQTKWVEMQPDSKHNAWVGYGNVNYIARDTIANTRITHYSTDSNTVDIEEYDHPVPVAADGMVTKTVRKENTSYLKNQSLNLSIPVVPISVGVSNSYGENTIVTDYMDLNGDRYPDFVGQVNVQYSQPWGGIGSLRPLDSQVQGISSSGTISEGTTFGGSFSIPSRTSSNNPKNAKISFDGAGNVGASHGGGSDLTQFSWMDVNGDGLPDKVNAWGLVALNAGYGFLPYEDWHTSVIREGSSSNFGLNAGCNFNVGQASIGGGVGVNLSRNSTHKMLMDFNGDGLPDVVEKTANGLRVKYNRGAGSWSAWESISGISDLSHGCSYSESMDASVTLGMTLFSILKVCVGVSGSPYNKTFSKDSVQLTDINGDGYPDYVTSNSESSMSVRYNQSGKTNLLRKVTNFTGSTIELDYDMPLSCFEKPQRSWNLAKVEVTNNDTLCQVGGNRSVTTFEYGTPHYNRYERMDYGYDTVISYQWNTCGAMDSLYRYTVENYDNQQFNRRGKKIRDCIYDAQGNPFLENLYEVTMVDFLNGDTTKEACPSFRYKGRETDIRKYYEGDSIPHIITAVQREYDRRRNVTRYVNFGYGWNNPSRTDEYFMADIHYAAGMSHNLISLQDSIVVKDFQGNVLQKRSAQYDSIGRLKHICQYINANRNAEYDFQYDTYGNVTRVLYPENSNAQRFWCDYTYDTIVHSYPSRVKNAHGYCSSAEYEYRFGKPTKTIDINGNEMWYEYDHIGRLTKICGPYEQDSSQAFTIMMKYHPHKHYNATSTNPYSYACTYHYDAQHPTDSITTTLICDGLGRMLQTKKDAEINGQEMSLVTGKVVYDCFGRTVKQYHPFTESIGLRPTYNPYYDSTTATSTKYDILDRQTCVELPLNNYTTSYSYGFGLLGGDTVFSNTVTDPNGMSVTTLTGSRQQQLKTIAPLNTVTAFEYSPLGQLLRSTDPDNLSTTYQYDMLGRMTQRVHPDAGTDRYVYDPAGNMESHINGNGQTVKYKYNYNQLTDIEYLDNPANNVHYTYGDSGAVKNRAGRIMLQEDASGWQIFSYGKLGEVTENIRTFALPFETKPYTFKMTYDYDSFNRMQQMTYPDGEVVSYRYNRGGMLDSIGGRKGTHAYPYIAHIAYNRFELKDSVRYGNGALNAYHYDKLQRLDTLKSFTGDTLSRNMQYIVYDYDAVGNILNINNLADTVNALGGRYGIQYNYDDLYRLTKADGHWDGIPDTSYSVAMKYYANGRIMNKKVANTSTIVNNGFDTPIDYDRKYTYVSGTSKLYKISETNGLAQQFGWDGSGNMVWHRNVSKQCDRRYCWDEDNRLQGAIDCHYASFYQYDAGGERTYKLTGKNVQQGNNANIQNYPMFDNPTLYASPYVICTPKGYTKHYYAESERVASRIGNGCLKDLCTTLNVTADFNREDTSGNVYLYDCQQDNETFLEKIDTNEAHLGKVMECLQSEKETVKSGLDKLHAYIECPGEQEQECYWYHPDHLGSSSWITFADGTPVQHLHYLPWGEDFVNQRTTGWSARHSFSAKERDSETGLSYFGSRYYSADLSLWLSVDPMSGKYPSTSPYAYCRNNPIILIDQKGMDDNPIFSTEGKLLGTDKDGWKGTPIVMEESQFHQGMDRNKGTKDEIGTPLDKYGKGISISEEDWKTVESNGGKRLLPSIENRSSETIYYKPETTMGEYKNDGAYPLEAGKDLYMPVDGIKTSTITNYEVFKIPDGFRCEVWRNGEPNVINLPFECLFSKIKRAGKIKTPDKTWENLQKSIK